MIITPIQPTGDFSTCAVMFACIPVQIVDAYTKAETDLLLNGKQKLLIAGDNITIEPDGTINSTGGGGATIHNELLQRDAADAHPIGAISGLQAELDSKLSTLSFEDKYADTIARWLNVFPTSYNASVDVVNETFTVVGETIGIEDAVQTLQNYQSYTQIGGVFTNGETPKVLIPKGRTISATLFTAFASNTNIEVLYIEERNIGDVNLTSTFYNTNLKKCIGGFRVKENNSISLPVSLVYLDVVFIQDAYLNLFSQVTFDNMELLLNQADNGGAAVTWTLHPDIFDKITNVANPDYTQWSTLATLAASKNITITT